ncbi:MAG TPA: DUF916 and DUF3324 domain-containing protein [Tetragenococcus sp.]|nr:DUF916 and DUF3324 domain-containing protein [Tetragenococcus sp.]
MKKIFFVILTLITFMTGGIVSADESPIDYQVRAQLPDNQKTKDNTYFDLQVKPGEKQTITIEIKNLGSKKKQMVVEANNATTSDGVTISYSRTKNPLLSSPGFSQMISKDQQKRLIEVKPKESKVVAFDLTYPKKTFSGYVLGGIHLYEQKQENSEKKDGISFQNQFAYSIAVKLQMKDQKLTPQLDLGNVKMTTENSHPIVQAQLKNPVATMINDLNIEAEISKKGKTVENFQFEQGKVAPNSQFHLTIPLSQGSLKPGTYLFSGQATSGKNHWKWEKKFTVSNKNYHNAEKENVEKTSSHWLWIFLGIIVILMVLLLLFIYLKKRKKDIS